MTPRGSRWRRSLAAVPAAAPSAVAAAGLLTPLVYLVLRALEADPNTVRELVFRFRHLQLLWNTTVLLLGLVFTTTGIAFPLAVLTARSDLPAARAFVVLHTLPLAVPGYVGAYVLLAATGPGGLLPVPRPSGYVGALLVLTVVSYPYVYLPLRASLQGLDPALQESARALGSGRLRSFLLVTFPQLRPALLAGALLVALHALGDFGTVSLMRYETFSYAVYLQYSAAFDRTYAAWLALLLVGYAGALLLLEWRLLRRLTLARTGTGAPRRSRPVRLGRWTPLALVATLGPVVIALVFPLAALLDLASRFPAGEARGLREAVEGSLTLATAAAVASTALAVPLASAATRSGGRLGPLIERLPYLGYAVPPLALALAWIFFTLRVLPALYGTLVPPVVALAFHLLPEALGPIRGAIRQVPRTLEESARTLGAGRVRTLLQVTLPLVWRGTAAGGALAFVGAMKELPITLLLTPTGYSTLATRMFSYTQDAMFAEAAPFALALVTVSALFIGALVWSERTFSS